MNRRVGSGLFAIVLFGCSSTETPISGAAGASTRAGTGGNLPADGGAGASPAGASGDVTNAGSGGTSTAGTGSGGVLSVAGASVGGMSGSGAAGTGGASAAGPGGAGGAAGRDGGSGSAGSAGTPAKYCDSHPLVPAPVIVTEAFEADQVGSNLDLQLTEYDYPAVCDDPLEANAVGSCVEWKYTPKTGGGSIIKLQYISDPSGIKYAPVCMAGDMNRVLFAAKGNIGGEVVGFGASQAETVYIPLTTTWTHYAISLINVNYNTALQGVQPAFFWIADPAKNPGTIQFAVDDIQYVNN